MLTSNRFLLAATTAVTMSLATAGHAATPIAFDIPAGPLAAALETYAAQSRQQLLYSPDLVSGRTVAAIQGRRDPEAVLQQLLAGTGIVIKRARPGVIVLQGSVRSAAGTTGSAAVEPPVVVDEVVVTGTLFRGASPASPVQVLKREDIDRSGAGTVADALTALPQAFGGTSSGDTFLTLSDAQGTNSALATGINLRGLGSDATLVLVNGRRLAGTGTKGDFADVSAIPLAAIDRVDVLLDGASALYGPDLTEEIMSNCGVEVVFAPKELHVAQTLSERLGYHGYVARSHSRPSGLSRGRRSQTQSEQRRALMLPQELLQLDPRSMIVLTAGAPPVLGRKLAYYREPDFARRVAPPPDLPTPVLLRTADVAAAPDTMSLTEAAAILAADGLEPPPRAGAADHEVEAWVDRFLTATAPAIATEIDHAR
ncbi:MAG: type IV secretory system conjugative DNA transfer family protein [Pseudomonadota bacterium]